MSALLGLAVGFVALAVGVPIVLALARTFGVYATVMERTARVYVLFGRVLGVLDEPGFHWLFAELGWQALLVGLLGKCHVVDLRMDQVYLRSQPVNSEEGAPMGIGVWYEMTISDPVAYLFKNTDPRSSLRANVGNTTVRVLSNMKLADMLETRHAMSLAVRSEVSPKSAEWGYALGSIYIRKVHFRDIGMIRQIEEKVVNRLRQVTSAIRQDGANQVSLLGSAAERTASVEFAKAAALRPNIVGEAMRQVMVRPDVAEALFEILETSRLVEGDAQIVLLPKGARDALMPLLAMQPVTKDGEKVRPR